jgi:hypothetical protein
MQARMLKRVKTGSNLFIIRALGKNKNLVYKNNKNLIYSNPNINIARNCMSIKPVKLNIGNKKRGEGPFEIFFNFFLLLFDQPENCRLLVCVNAQ